MPLPPSMRAYVLATAFFTSVFFAIGAFLPVGLLLRAILNPY